MKSLVRWAAAMVAGLLISVLASRAHAYAWMIRHGYSTCMPCHTDPSGGSPLTSYGRDQGELLLGTRYGNKSEEASPRAGLLWGAVEVPEEVRVGGDLRGELLITKPEGAPADHRWILLRSDLYGDFKLDRIRLAGSLGYAHEGALQSALTRGASDNLISREHWVGFEIDPESSWLIRAGRIALPFGLRNTEHSLWVRTSTRTDLLDNQQHGLALSFSSDWIRAEVMAVLGNFQLRPDEYRERGYSAYAEVSPLQGLALGASSLFTRAERDVNFHVTNYRQSHGLFVRYSPDVPLVVLGEGDWLYQSLTSAGHRGGYAVMVQGDWEAVQGVHFIVTGESKNDGAAGETSSYGIWGSAAWFFAPHADVRIDNVYQSLGSPVGNTGVFSMFAQMHVYL